MEIDMDEAINGLVEFEYGSPNQRNEMWAQSLASTALSGRQDITGDCKIPTDVFAVIAEILAGSRDLETLARLNVASHELHQGTLPVLYETVTFTDERSLRHAFKKLPAGWRYTKFVFVTETTLPQLQLHQQYHSPDPNKWNDDLRAIFPRLTAMGLAHPASPASSFGSDQDRQLALTLYRPVRFTSLLRSCLPYGLDGSREGIAFFGTHYLRQDPTKTKKGQSRRNPYTFVNISRVQALPGAGITPEKQMSTALEGWHARWSGTDFAIELPGEADDMGVEETLRTVMDHLALYSSSKLVVGKTTRKGISEVFKIKCAASVWEKFVELYDARQPCFLNIRATLTTRVTRPAMKEYLTSIASIYHQHWSQYDQEDTSLFLQLEARATEIDRDWIREFHLANDPEAHLNHQEWHGAAQYGWNGARDDDEDPEERWQHDLAAHGQGGANPDTDFLPGSGFEMILSRALMWKDEHQHGEQFWSRGYLAAPRPPAPADQVPEEIPEDELPEEEQIARFRERAHAELLRQQQERQLNPQRTPQQMMEFARDRLLQNPVEWQRMLENHPELHRRLFGLNPVPPPGVEIPVLGERVRVVQFAENADVQEIGDEQEENDVMQE